jgi:hypothetical protein
MYDLGGSVSYYRNFLFPDSTVQVEFSSGYGYVWKHSLGHVFDPTSYMFDNTGQVTVFPSASYTLDSIAIPYRYWRPQNGAPDTLLIQVYKESDIFLQPSPGWTSGASYASVDYDYTTRSGTNDSYSFKYLLTSADEINATQGILQFYIGMNIVAGGKVGVTVTYFPGNAYNVGDTIDTYAATTPTNQINAFVMYDYSDEDLNYEPYYYNNELTATTDVRYNISTTGWNGNYIPGTAWFGGIYHGDIYFRITFDNDVLSTNEVTTETDWQVYPNPAHDMIYFNGTQTVSEVAVYDVNGKQVLFQHGGMSQSISLNHLEKGLYTLRLYNENGLSRNYSFIKQ